MGEISGDRNSSGAGILLPSKVRVLLSAQVSEGGAGSWSAVLVCAVIPPSRMGRLPSALLNYAKLPVRDGHRGVSCE